MQVDALDVITYLATMTANSSAQVKDVVLASTYTTFFWVSVGMMTELSSAVKASSVGPSSRISTLNCNTECRSPSLTTFAGNTFEPKVWQKILFEEKCNHPEFNEHHHIYYVLCYPGTRQGIMNGPPSTARSNRLTHLGHPDSTLAVVIRGECCHPEYTGGGSPERECTTAILSDVEMRLSQLKNLLLVRWCSTSKQKQYRCWNLEVRRKEKLMFACGNVT